MSMKLGELPLQVAASETVYVFPEDYCEFDGERITSFSRYGLDGNAPAVVDMVFPQQYDGMDITAIADNAFAGALDTTLIHMSAMPSVAIGSGAFKGLLITDLKLPSLCFLGFQSFESCSTQTVVS